MNPEKPFGHGEFMRISVPAKHAEQNSVPQAPEAGEVPATPDQAVEHGAVRSTTETRVYRREDPTPEELAAAREERRLAREAQAEREADKAYEKSSTRRKRLTRAGAGAILAGIVGAGAFGLSSALDSDTDKGPSYSTSTGETPRPSQPASPEAEPVPSTITIEPLKPATDTTVTRGKTGSLNDFLPGNEVAKVAQGDTVDVTQSYTVFTIKNPQLNRHEGPSGKLEVRTFWKGTEDPNTLTVLPNDPRMFVLEDNSKGSADLFIPTSEPQFSTDDANSDFMERTVFAIQIQAPEGSNREDINIVNLTPAKGQNGELTFKPQERDSGLDIAKETAA